MQLNAQLAGGISDQGFHAAAVGASTGAGGRGAGSASAGPHRGAGTGAAGGRGAKNAAGSGGGAGGSVMLDRPSGAHPADSAGAGAGAGEGGDDAGEYFEHRVLKPLPQYSGQLRELAEMIAQDIYSENPNTHWDDIVGLNEVRTDMQKCKI
jgi:hypothetical protein